MWAGRTVALLHCRTACTAEPANVRTFPSLSARSLDMCAHLLPRHLAKAGPFVRTFGRVRKVRTFFGCVRGDLQHPAKCAHKSRDGRLRGREMCAHSPWFSGATVQQCDGATRKRPWRTEQRSAGCPTGRERNGPKLTRGARAHRPATSQHRVGKRRRGSDEVALA